MFLGCLIIYIFLLNDIIDSLCIFLNHISLQQLHTFRRFGRRTSGSLINRAAMMFRLFFEKNYSLFFCFFLLSISLI